MYAQRLATRLGAVLFAASSLSTSWGDGLALKGGRDISQWLPLVENEQLAAIHHADGVERMILAINVDLENDADQALWIVPVPGAPDKVSVSISRKFPRFFGSDPRREASAAVNLNATLLRATQGYPLLAELCLLVPSLSTTRGIASHAEVEEFGLRCDVLTADSIDALGGHLRDQGVNVEPDQLATLQPYLSGEHVLIASWISSREQLAADFPDLDYGRPGSSAWPCIAVDFPTQKAFFPLKPTSAYGNVEVPLQLYVTGFVEPETAAPLIDDMRIGYYHQEGKSARDVSELLNADDFDELRYTAIRLDAEANVFTDDLWFVPTDLATMSLAEGILAISKSPARIAPFVLVWAMLSYVSAGLVGLALWRRWKEPARLGFWNMLTIGGMIIGLKRQSLTDRFGTVDDLDERKLRSHFVVMFSLIFVILSVVLQLVVNAPLVLL